VTFTWLQKISFELSIHPILQNKSNIKQLVFYVFKNDRKSAYCNDFWRNM